MSLFVNAVEDRKTYETSPSKVSSSWVT